MTQDAADKLQDSLKLIRKSFTNLLDKRLGDLVILRKQIDLESECTKPFKQIQFIAHQIAGTASTLGFIDIGLVASHAENAITQHLTNSEPQPNYAETIQTIDMFLEKMVEINLHFSHETTISNSGSPNL